MVNVRVYEIPACKMVSSQCGNFGDGKLEKFDECFSKMPKTLYPQDFLWYDEKRGGFVWYIIHDDRMDVPNDFEIVDFPGGLYAVATGIDGQDNAPVLSLIEAFIEKSGCFEEDKSRKKMGHIVTPQLFKEAVGYELMDYWTPIKIRSTK